MAALHKVIETVIYKFLLNNIYLCMAFIITYNYIKVVLLFTFPIEMRKRVCVSLYYCQNVSKNHYKNIKQGWHYPKKRKYFTLLELKVGEKVSDEIVERKM